MANTNSNPQDTSTWAPVIRLAEGGIIRLPGGLSCAEAMAMAERRARNIAGVDTISAILEREI